MPAEVDKSPEFPPSGVAVQHEANADLGAVLAWAALRIKLEWTPQKLWKAPLCARTCFSGSSVLLTTLDDGVLGGLFMPTKCCHLEESFKPIIHTKACKFYSSLTAMATDHALQATKVTAQALG